MRGLLIAEKPSVMRAIREVYSKEKNYPDQLDFGAFHGHLMQLKSPEDYDPAFADWKNVSALPIIPAAFSYKASDVKSVNELKKKITSGGYDFLVNACDAGREGEHIFWSFYETVGLKLPVKRFWAQSVTKPAIKKALYNLSSSSLYDGMRQAAKFRAQFDWLVGMNFTRAATTKLHRLTSIGRVQTPTLKLIVDRELEIQNFKPEDFYELKATFDINGTNTDMIHLVAPSLKTTRFALKKDADQIDAAVKKAGSGVVSEVKEEVKAADAPTLYSLTELQKDANKYLKFKPDKTLAITQKLYEDGYLTYPRTESRFLPTDMIPEIPAHIAPLSVVPELAKYVAGIGKPQIDAMLKKNYVNDAGITDHHAIIPTDQIPPSWGALSKDEQAIYTLVGKSFLAIFMPPYKVAMTTIMVNVGPHVFKAQGRVELDKGYSCLYSQKNNDVKLPACKKGDTAKLAKTTVTKSTTKAPQRYTPRTILSAMKNAGQDLPDSAMRAVLRESSGLGTTATRADILKKLEDREYVELKGNNYYALQKGISLIKDVGDRTFCSPLLTGQWEEKLSAIEKNSYKGDFRAEMEDYIKSETAQLLSSIKSDFGEVIGKCPVCGANVVSTPKACICERRRKDDPNSCSFWMPKVVGGKTLDEEDLLGLLAGKETKTYTVKTKAGKDWQACFYLDENHAFQAKSMEPRVIVGNCPVCKKPVCAAANAFYCSGKDEKSCTWSFPRVIKGTSLKDSDMKALLSGKRTREMTFVWNSGKKGKAQLYLENAKLQWAFAS